MSFYRCFCWLTLAVPLFVGCRQSAPPRFDLSQEVQDLTEGIDDPNELDLFKSLQVDIETTLREETGTPDKLFMLGDAKETREPLLAGYHIYQEYCTQCHGVNGDGNGPVAQYLNPKPRNYKPGIFKFTSTPYGSKPRKSDLILTLKRGVTGTSMPAFDRFSDQQLSDVADYVIALSLRGEFERELALIAYDDAELPDKEGMKDVINDKLSTWHDAANQLVMPVSEMPEMTDESIRAGHRVFLQYACNKCHGKYGRGGSMGNVEVGVDSWGNKAAAADLSSGMFRGGERPIDIYRRIYSGINGTPMPAFKEQFKDNPEVIWQLVHFIKETGERRRRGQPPLGEDDLPEAESATGEEQVADNSEDAAEPPDGETVESEDTGTSESVTDESATEKSEAEGSPTEDTEADESESEPASA